jgi:hypothetical protein
MPEPGLVKYVMTMILRLQFGAAAAMELDAFKF